MPLNNSYSSIEDARVDVIKHCCDIGVNIRWKKSERKLIFAVCRHALDCPFAIYISFDVKTHSFLLRRYNAQCIHMASSKRHLTKSSEWISLKYSTILKQPNVSSSVVINMIKEDLGKETFGQKGCF